jgi:lambda family phage portal protein
LARGAIDTVVTNVVGTGLVAVPKIDRESLRLSDEQADAWERQAGELFWSWAEGASHACDATRAQSFCGIQAVTLASALINGDHFLLKRYIERPGEPLGFCLQQLEADRIGTPIDQRDGPIPGDDGRSIQAGVELDRDGAPLAYHIASWHPGSLGRLMPTYQAVPAFDERGRRMVIHVLRRRRADQARGEPYLAPVIETIRMLGDYTDAEVAAAVISAKFTVFVKGVAPTASGGVTEQASIRSPGPGRAPEWALGSGAILDLADGEDVSFANPSRPNEKFDPFVTSVLRQVGVALELPFEILIKHFTASYSAARAALLEAWKMFRSRRYWLASELCQPVYEEVIAEAVARGLLAAPGFLRDPRIRRAYLGCDWHGPSQGQIDPEKEANAAAKWIDLEIKTREEVTAEITGGDYEYNHKQRAKEERLRRQDGLALPLGAPPGGNASPPAPAALDDQPEKADAA